MSSCSEFDPLIARNGGLSPEEAATLDAHLATCASCRDLARVLAPVDDEAPKDRYRIHREVGRGGIGRVLEALDQVLDRPVALKELFTENADLRRRFVREALITARLQHPSIVPVYDAGHLGDRSPFYAMKLVDGQTLHDAIGQTHSLAERLALLPSVLAVADAMAYAHSKRIIHRDLKPSNILVGAFGETIVIDWGLAKDLAVADDDDTFDAGPYRSSATKQTTVGVVLGTPAFMAPEQAGRKTVDQRADVYALGAILYWVVSGEIPHEGETFEELSKRIVAGDVKPIAERTPDVPRDLAAIVGKAMAVAPGDRYQHAGGLADDLRRFLTGQLVGSHTYGIRELAKRWVKRHRAVVAVALAALVAMTVVGVTSIVRVVNARERAEEQRAIAEQQTATANDRLARLLEEQGRQELLAGHPTRAITYLSKAYAQSPDAGPGLRTLLADAMRSVEVEQVSIDGHVAAFSPDGTKLVTDNTLRDATTGTAIATLGDDDRVDAVAFGADGRMLTTTKGSTRVWDGSGKPLATVNGAGASLTRDGARLITVDAFTSAQLWDGKTYERLGSFDGHQNKVYAATLSADGSRLVTASADHTAKIWEVSTRKLLHSLAGHRDEVIAAAFSPDGSQVVTASDDRTAKLWDAKTGLVTATLMAHTGPVHVAAFSPDGTRIVTASEDRSAKLWDAKTGELRFSLDGHTGPLTVAAFSADGARVATAGADRVAKLWDVRTGKLLATFEGHRDDFTSVSFRPDGAQLMTASSDGAVKLWNAMSSTARVAIDDKPARGVLTADGAKLATSIGSTVKLWDARTGKPLVTLDGHRGEVSSLAFDADGTRVVTGSSDQTAKLWNATTGKLLGSIEHPGAVRTVAFSSDGARLITSSERGLWVWNSATGAPIAKFDIAADEHPIRLGKDATTILVSSATGARIKSVDTGKVIVELAASSSPISAATFSVDGERLATVGLDRTIAVWNARTGALVAQLEGSTTALFGGWFNTDGTRLLTISDDHSAKLWDAATGKLLASYDGHRDEIVKAVFMPDGRVLTTSADRTAKLWDERTGKLLASFEHTEPLLDGVFVRDRVITIAGDGSIASWDVHLEHRTPETIRHLVETRSPWTLAEGVLVPDARRGNR